MERKAEMEDVLSSIRRLVSEEVRTQEPLAPSKEPKGGLSASADASDRLVLSPALRVLPDVAPEASPESEDVLQLSEMEMRDLHDLPAATPAELREAADVLSTDEFAVETVLPDADVAKANARLVSLEDTIAELESVVSDQNIEFEPDGSEEVGSSPEVETLDWVPHFVSVGQKKAAEPEADLPKTEMRTDVEEEGGQEPALELSEVSRSEKQDLQFEAAETLAQDAEAAEALAFEDSLENTAEPAVEAFEPAPADPQDQRADEDAFILDEDALRDLVRDLVREELQGVLGERITRNVRKLVRTEINRVLATQDFE